jgi:predicted nucleic acid-binding protein
MIRVLLDTNIILDIALERGEFYENSKDTLLLINKSKIQAYVTATTVTDIYYILKKSKGHRPSMAFLRNLFDFFDIADVGKETIIHAMTTEMSDFEDAVQVESAKQSDIDIIISRNKSDFLHSGIEVLTPLEFIHFQKGKK